jgi:hypothetical protein
VVAAQLAVTSIAVGTFTTVTTEFPPIGGYYWRIGANQSIKVLVGVGSRRRSASQAIDLPSDGGVNLGV